MNQADDPAYIAERGHKIIIQDGNPKYFPINNHKKNQKKIKMYNISPLLLFLALWLIILHGSTFVDQRC